MRRTRSKTHPAATQPRPDRALRSQEHDSYGLHGKLSDPTACPSCGAVYRNGRWIWGTAPSDAQRTECPACRRSVDGYPAGIVTLRGAFATERRAEIRNLVRHVEERERKEHALKRIMEIREEGDYLVVTTTNARLARGIGEALHHAYQGNLDYRFSEGENVMRVNWER
jgi:NMD protein affecting ribosome stability and mRNA decay